MNLRPNNTYGGKADTDVELAGLQVDVSKYLKYLKKIGVDIGVNAGIGVYTNS